MFHLLISLCRYKTVSIYTKLTLIIWFYSCLYKALVVFKIWCSISVICNVYLFRNMVYLGLRNNSREVINKSYYTQLEQSYSWLHIKLGLSSIGISFRMHLLGIEIAYSHDVMFRLFHGLIGMNPLFLFTWTCISLVLGISTFYYEYTVPC